MIESRILSEDIHTYVRTDELVNTLVSPSRYKTTSLQAILSILPKMR